MLTGHLRSNKCVNDLSSQILMHCVLLDKDGLPMNKESFVQCNDNTPNAHKKSSFLGDVLGAGFLNLLILLNSKEVKD